MTDTTWLDDLNGALIGIERKIEASAKAEAEERYQDLLEDLGVFPDSKTTGLHIWSCDEIIRTVPIGDAILEWMDTDKNNQTLRKDQMLAWAAELDRIAARIRTVVEEGRYADDEE